MEVTYGVIGTGAIGGFYGGILANLGKKVNFLLHSDYEIVEENGLFIDSKVFGKIECKGSFFNSVEGLSECDVILVGLKSTQNYLLKDLLSPILKENTVVILIQNGLGAEEELQKEFPDLSIVGGVAQILSSKSNPGIITHYQLGNLTLGAYKDREIPLLNQIIEDFNQTKKISCIQKNLDVSRWIKLLWNVPFNGLSVILDAKTDAMIQDYNVQKLAKDIMNEILEGARKSGVDIPEQMISDQIEITKKMPSYFPSMKLDFDNNRPMEIYYMYEKPIEIAKRSGYYMSKVDMLAKQLHFVEDRKKS